MPKEEWGVKRVCPSCSTRFYDLLKDPMTCPACGATFTLESLTSTKTKAPRPEKAAPAAAAVVVDDDDVPDIEDESDDIQDDSDDDDIEDEILEEDDDDTVDLEEITDVPAEEDDS